MNSFEARPSTMEKTAKQNEEIEIVLTPDSNDPFERYSVSQAVKAYAGGIAAKSNRFEIWARRYRTGAEGRRGDVIVFSAVEIVSHEPRRVQEVPLPGACRSNLVKAIRHLESMKTPIVCSCSTPLVTTHLDPISCERCGGRLSGKIS